MYFFATGGGGSGVRIPDVPFDITNIFSFMVWVIQVFAPLAEIITRFLFTSWTGNWGTTYTLATILLNPVTLGTIWFAHAARSLTQ